MTLTPEQIEDCRVSSIERNPDWAIEIHLICELALSALSRQDAPPVAWTDEGWSLFISDADKQIWNKEAAQGYCVPLFASPPAAHLPLGRRLLGQNAAKNEAREVLWDAFMSEVNQHYGQEVKAFLGDVGVYRSCFRRAADRISAHLAAQPVAAENDDWRYSRKAHEADVAAMSKVVRHLQEQVVWAMCNMTDAVKVQFASHVLNRGGTGDYSDCDTFIDAARPKLAAPGKEVSNGA